ncbi:MAG: ribbon-helix-helix domain-containing protein [Methylocystis sp.]|nr:ribbon-helix-helix domain-containing protein [Methylocystis sp.]MCA3583385.1 ribbon-helix-helix domain-containing protein [Methylocystis sp.]MCA3589765.1 ribbon-helix-helix domain-containing protein [Methylocystis sp.]MCA3591904.1 ribbon-helix-helix domain-containing protein [Methylocystis sp.]
MPESPDGIIKRSVMIAGHRTSVSVEQAFWDHLKRLAEARGLSTGALIAEIDQGRKRQNLSSAIRLYVLEQVAAR